MVISYKLLERERREQESQDADTRRPGTDDHLHLSFIIDYLSFIRENPAGKMEDGGPGFVPWLRQRGFAVASR